MAVWEIWRSQQFQLVLNSGRTIAEDLSVGEYLVFKDRTPTLRLGGAMKSEKKIHIKKVQRWLVEGWKLWFTIEECPMKEMPWMK